MAISRNTGAEFLRSQFPQFSKLMKSELGWHDTRVLKKLFAALDPLNTGLVAFGDYVRGTRRRALRPPQALIALFPRLTRPIR